MNMERLPDLVADSKLETEYNIESTIHTYYESSATGQKRGTLRREVWKVTRRIGHGGFSRVYLEECITGHRDVKVRAVKKIPSGGQTLTKRECIRELEAIAKFSQPKVGQSNQIAY